MKRWTEFLILYFAIPATCIFIPRMHVFLIPVLVVMSVFCFIRLRRDPTFYRKVLRFSGTVPAVARLLPAAALAFAVLAACVWLFHRETFFLLPQKHPGLWIAILVLYPVLSVVPQEMIYRVYFFHRFERLFSSAALANFICAAIFGLHHWIFHNWVAVALTLVGGWKFAATYRHTRSLWAVSIEHAIYGGILFTVGLGQFFYTGTWRVAEKLIGH